MADMVQRIIKITNFSVVKLPFTLLLIAFTACMNLPITARAQANVNDSLALVDLYNSTNGAAWLRNDNWLNGPVKSWFGIILNFNDGRVYSIRLASNNLSGFIPASSGNFSDLADLSLYNNQLTGNIPPELGNLAYLSNLNLSNNQLTGNIPPELGNLLNLNGDEMFLDLSDNRLSGNIPAELGNISVLIDLIYPAIN